MEKRLPIPTSQLEKKTLQFPQKLNIELARYPSSPLSRIYPKELKAGTQILVYSCSLQRYSQQPKGK